MKLKDQVNSIASDISRQTERFVLYREIERIFKDVDAALDANVYSYKSSLGDRVYIEFSPGYDENDTKDLRPLVHKIARKFHVKFSKNLNYEGTSLDYHGEFQATFMDLNDCTISMKIAGVVPKTCRIEETVTPLSDEEIEEQKREALKSVKTERVERKIVCR